MRGSLDHIGAERLRQLLDYDPSTGVFTQRPNGSGYIPGRQTGSVGTRGYKFIRVDDRRYFAHRLAWLYVHGSLDPEMRVDHINGDTGDNRIENLRLVTQSLNLCNQRLSSKSTSGVKGVHFCKASNRWRVEVRLAGRRHRHNGFLTLEEAKRFAVKLRERLHGEYARHA